LSRHSSTKADERGVRGEGIGERSGELYSSAASNVLTPKFSESSDPKMAERRLALGGAEKPALYPALSEPAALERVGTGLLTVLLPDGGASGAGFQPAS